MLRQSPPCPVEQGGCRRYSRRGRGGGIAGNFQQRSQGVFRVLPRKIGQGLPPASRARVALLREPGGRPAPGRRPPCLPFFLALMLQLEMLLLFYQVGMPSFIAKTLVGNDNYLQILPDGNGEFQANRVRHQVEPEHLRAPRSAASSKPAMLVSRCLHVIKPLVFSFVRTEESLTTKGRLKRPPDRKGPEPFLHRVVIHL